MMKKAVFSSLLLAGSAITHADTPVDPNTQNDISNLSQYVRVLGEYLGYDLTNYCPQTGGPCSSTPGSGQTFTNLLLNAATASGYQVNLMASALGALLPANPSESTNQSGISFQLIPSTSASLSGYSSLFSKYGNQSFPQFGSQSSAGVSVSNLIDQSPYQTDPVSQAILNIVATPDASFCVNPGNGYFNPCYTGENNSNKNGGGPVLSQNQVIMNVIGNPPPATGMFPLPATNAKLIPQLSSDSLLGPLMFNTSGSNQSDNSAGVNTGSEAGLAANNQVQQAANYIRYATGEVVPLTLPNRSDYDNLYATAINAAGNVSQDQQVQAQSTLSTYLNNLRIYASQMSVGVSNLYYILSKRMPQNAAAGNNEQTSQALSEFTMATWRLYSPSTSNSNQANQQWLAQINQASSATVQKETAILLAEINYQLYLSRQLQERILLTNTMMLIQNTRASQPSASITSAANTPSSASGTADQ